MLHKFFLFLTPLWFNTEQTRINNIIYTTQFIAKARARLKSEELLQLIPDSPQTVSTLRDCFTGTKDCGCLTTIVQEDSSRLEIAEDIRKLMVYHAELERYKGECLQKKSYSSCMNVEHLMRHNGDHKAADLLCGLVMKN